MSLKTFHIIFITAAILVCLFFGAWSINFYAQKASGGYLLGAAVSFLLSISLIVYEYFFIKKIAFGDNP